MTDTRNLAKLDVDRDLALSDAKLVPVAFREPLPPKTISHRHSRRSVLTLGIAVLLIAAAAAYGGYYWAIGRFLQSTDDAYVQADSTIVAPKVSGYLSKVLVEDNQPVKADQPLAKIDDRDYVASLDQAKADVATAQADIENVTAALQQQQAVIAQARDTAQSTLTRDTAAVTAAEEQVGVLQAQLAKGKATLQHYQAVQEQAQLNLGYTNIVAPIDGVVGARSLRVGEYVQAGTQLMAVVPLAAVYVVANFEETQLAGIRKGAPVNIVVDTYSGATVKGHVDSIAPASGEEFALLPPDNATGNFTKIVQRIPVKIAIDPSDPLRGELRPGMSVTATVDTKEPMPGSSPLRPPAVH
jgi:membrane fusion protein (multidrug efflux system)